MEAESTGIPSVDLVMQGLPYYGLTTIVGSPGSGKTVLAMQSANHAARQGRPVLYLTAFSESHEKLIEHMRGFSFFNSDSIGVEIEMLSLKSFLEQPIEDMVRSIFRTTAGKQHPLLVLDGYRGIQAIMGRHEAQQFLSALASQLPYFRASCLITAEAETIDVHDYPELTTTDAIILLSRVHYGGGRYRTFEVGKVRGHPFKEGTHGMAITTDGIVVYPRLATVLPEQEPDGHRERQRFGLPELDRMLGGGLPRFSATVVYGEPGTGKTTLSLQYLATGAEAGQRGLLVTFQEPREALLRKADSLGIPLSAALQSGMVEIMRQAPVELHPDRLAWEITRHVQERGVERLVIDGVANLERVASVLGTESDYLAAFLEYLRRIGTTVFMAHDRGRPTDTSQSVPVTMPGTPNRILLRRVEYRAAWHRLISIVSMQASSHDTSICEFRIEPAGLRILDPSESDVAVLASMDREQSLSGLS